MDWPDCRGKEPIQLGAEPEKELLHRELTNIVHLCRQNREKGNGGFRVMKIQRFLLFRDTF